MVIISNYKIRLVRVLLPQRALGLEWFRLPCMINQVCRCRSLPVSCGSVDTWSFTIEDSVFEYYDHTRTVSSTELARQRTSLLYSVSPKDVAHCSLSSFGRNNQQLSQMLQSALALGHMLSGNLFSNSNDRLYSLKTLTVNIYLLLNKFSGIYTNWYYIDKTLFCQWYHFYLNVWYHFWPIT